MRPLSLSALGFLLVISVLAADRQAVAEPKLLDKQEVCPVFPDRKIYLSSRTERFRGIKVYFSSDLAARRFLREPAPYLDIDILPQLQGLTLPKSPIKQVWCPVYRDRKVSHRDPSVYYHGIRIYLFDEAAVLKWNHDPQRYADPEWLPQLPRPEAEVSDDNAPMN
jgi:hypothetical protein